MPHTLTAERDAIARGWYYVVEPADGAYAPAAQHIRAGDGAILTRRSAGYPGRIVVQDAAGVPAAAWLRAASAAGRALEAQGLPPDTRLRITLGPAGTASAVTGPGEIALDGPALAALPAPHAADALLLPLVAAAGGLPDAPPPALPARPAGRALFFEALMNSEQPHNDREISQGVLHMASALSGAGTAVALASVKMGIVGQDRPVIGLEGLVDALRDPVGLVCITLLEGYFEGVVALIEALRAAGCRAHVAVGGVMPSLSPEQAAAHLPEVSFVCRGAGEPFLPRLAAILGDSTRDDPFTGDQIRALAELDGLLALDRAGGRLVAGRCDVIVEVPDLDRVQLDLSYIQPRHVEGGIELSTSRGCLHRCSFCTILGRERYQARSAEGLFELLARYEDRFREMFGDRVPSNAYRVHLSDDDFACDRERAIAFLSGLRRTNFRLSSLQVSIADLCQRQGGRLLPAVDPAMLDALDPACFADHGRPIPPAELLADHRPRGWSSFLQIGVETFCDAELVRLGKGYRVAHVRAVVDALSRRGVHMDAYFIAANTETTADDLVDSLVELCRLKIRYPRHFHLRFPTVPRLVSYFPSATWRRKVRQGERDTVKLRYLAAIPGFPELDYPFVDHDLPRDPWVAAASDFLTDEGRYTASLTRLRDQWAARAAGLPDGPERREGERLCRRLEDLPRRLVLQALQEARGGREDRPPGRRAPT